MTIQGETPLALSEESGSNICGHATGPLPVTKDLNYCLTKLNRSTLLSDTHGKYITDDPASAEATSIDNTETASTDATEASSSNFTAAVAATTDEEGHESTAAEIINQRCWSSELAKRIGLSVVDFPTSDREADIAEAAMEEEMRKLSINDQERLLFELHGISTTVEDPERDLDVKLEQLEAELKRITDKPAYDRALKMNPDYVGSIKFLAMFLRAEEYVPQRAAKLITFHFEMKQQLFGDGPVLGRPVLLKDMDQHDLLCLGSGVVQVAPSKDAAGRTVLRFTQIFSYKTVENLVSKT